MQAMFTHSRRLAFLGLGWACVGLGVVGIVVPGLPTTPFLLVAAWAFSKSSDRFRLWLYRHKRFGPPLRAWQRHGVIDIRSKIAALALMAVGVAFMLAFSGFDWRVSAALIAVIACAATFVATRPGRPPDGAPVRRRAVNQPSI